MDSVSLLKLLKVSNELIKSATTPDDAYQRGLLLICESYRWPVGHVYIIDETSGTLISSKTWFIGDDTSFQVFRRITESTTFSIGEGLPGRVLESKQPQWIKDVTKDVNFPRAKQAEDIGVKAAFGFPIVVNDKVVAVWEFFAKDAYEPDEELLVVINAVSSQISRIIERFFEVEYRDRAKKIANRSNDAVKKVEEELDAFSQIHKTVEGGLKEISAIINDVKLVSLNARIEAAKLGSEGARFNVVANEIGRMSTKMKASGDEVSEKLLNSQENNLRLVEHINLLTSLLKEVQTLRN